MPGFACLFLLMASHSPGGRLPEGLDYVPRLPREESTA